MPARSHILALALVCLSTVPGHPQDRYPSKPIQCVDHFIVLGEEHLCRILRAYARYYNEIRTHRSLDKDAPVSRTVQRTGIFSSRRPILGGLHHQYVWV